MIQLIEPTILKNGGVYEPTVHDPDEEKAEIERYWITLSE